MKNFDWTFPIVIGILGLLIGQIYIAQETSIHWTWLILTSVTIAFVSAAVANQGIPKKGGALSIGGGEGQGPWYSRFLLVFIIMLVVSSGVAVLGYDQR